MISGEEYFCSKSLRVKVLLLFPVCYKSIYKYLKRILSVMCKHITHSPFKASLMPYVRPFGDAMNNASKNLSECWFRENKCHGTLRTSVALLFSQCFSLIGWINEQLESWVWHNFCFLALLSGFVGEHLENRCAFTFDINDSQTTSNVSVVQKIMALWDSWQWKNGSQDLFSSHLTHDISITSAMVNTDTATIGVNHINKQ